MRLSLRAISAAVALFATSSVNAVDIYVSDWSNNTIRRYDAATGSVSAGWTNPTVGHAIGVAVDSAGFVYAASENGN